jgi:hypothetical protein
MGWHLVCMLSKKFPEKIKEARGAESVDSVEGKFSKRNGWPYII